MGQKHKHLFIPLALMCLFQDATKAEFIPFPACDARSRYFMVSVQSYDIQPATTHETLDVHMRLRVLRSHLTVQYDRPSDRLDETTVSGLLHYLSCPLKRQLTLSLMLHAHASKADTPLVFQVTFSHFDEKRKNHPIKSPPQKIPRPVIFEKQIKIRGLSQRRRNFSFT